MLSTLGRGAQAPRYGRPRHLFGHLFADACAMVHRRPPRLKTFDYRGKHRYFVTCVTHDRQKLFATSDVVVLLSEQILRTCEERCFIVLAYVFMEDHLHLLVEGKCEDAHFVSMMTLLRQRAAVAYNRVHRGRLWHDGYFERVLRPTDDVFEMIRYIQDNPAHAGLPIERADYPFV
jgi:REP element-mobilizing transposase RayT